MENLLNVIFPPKCLFCGDTKSLFCHRCLELCRPFQNTDLRAVSLLIYEGLVRKCIQKSKYSSKQFKALKILTEYGLNMFAGHRYSSLYKGHLVVPIPLSRSKSKQRGFNQADLIASEVSRHFGLKKVDSILTRTKDTKSQFGLSRPERFKNLLQAFSIPEKMVSLTKNAKILLVDDICTSGATFSSASGVFYGAGASEVRCFSLAKAIRNK